MIMRLFFYLLGLAIVGMAVGTATENAPYGWAVIGVGLIVLSLLEEEKESNEQKR